MAAAARGGACARRLRRTSSRAPAVRMIWQCPQGARAVVVLAHGAGAGMRHRNMQAIADALERRRIGTLRFDFPFIEAGRKRADSREAAIAAITEAYASAAARTELPLYVGGHSFGGRMGTHAAADGAVEPRGLVLYSFPLHPAGKPGTERARHLGAIRRPMLFVSGTRDALAEGTLLEPLIATLPRAELHWLAMADHGYRVLKRERGTTADVFDELAEATRAFIDRIERSDA
jgi:uncharacterized protein